MARPRKDAPQFTFTTKPSQALRVLFLTGEKANIDQKISYIQQVYNPNVAVIVNRSFIQEQNVYDYLITLTGDSSETVREAFELLNFEINGS